MTMRIAYFLALALSTSNLLAQAPGQREQQIQQEKLAVLDRLDGNWRGKATIITPDGEKLELVQTERVGPLLDGAVKVVEGSGYGADDTKQFNALGIISYDVRQSQYQMRSYAQGRIGDFQIEITDTGFSWKIPAGPATIRYVATITDSTWHEIGQRIIEGQEPFTFIEMKLKKIGGTDWPAGKPVPSKLAQ